MVAAAVQEREVLTPIRGYFDALNAHDLGAIVSVFAPNAVVMPNEGASAIGLEAVRATYAGRFATFDYQRELHVDEWLADGDLAIVRCHTTGSFTHRADGRRVVGVSRELFVLERQAGGWLVRCYMFNRDADPRHAAEPWTGDQDGPRTSGV